MILEVTILSKYCIKCGSQLGEGEKFCANCGQPVLEDNSTNNSTIPHKDMLQDKISSKTKYIILVSLITTMIIFAGGWYLNSKWKNGKDSNTFSNSNTTINNPSNNTNSANNSTTDTSNNSKNNTQSVNTLSDEMIKNYISLADSMSLGLFRAAFEAEVNKKTKQSFSSIKPLLQNHYSDVIINENLKPFYENQLGEWGYELGKAFPFYDKTYFDKCNFNVIQRTDSIVQVKILDKSLEPVVFNIYTLKRYDNIWKIENIQMITND